jgi:glycosyltransferase involved in cell wall biosynthesis
MRILHAPHNYADQAGTVVRALRAMGHEAELWEFGRSRFGFEADRSIDLSDPDPMILWDAFLEAKDRFDVIHFHFANSFFPFPWAVVPPYWDLPVLRMLGKKVFFTFHGSDVRMRKIHAERNPYSDEFFADGSPDDERIEKTINTIRTYANRMFVVSVELLDYVPDAKPVPRALDLSGWPEQPAEQRKKPVIVHIPSRRSFKGTQHILAGLDALKKEGLSFSFEIIENVPHEKVKDALRTADVLVDQVLMGDFGVASLETMACNRVAVAYLSDGVKKANYGIPVYDVTVETFVDRMRELIKDVAMRSDLAARGRAYVQDHFTAERTAGFYIEAYEADWPAITPRVFPDWMGFSDARRYEAAVESLAETKADRARFERRAREAERSAQELGVALEKERSRPWTPKDMLPPSVRKRLRKARARARK